MSHFPIAVLVPKILQGNHAGIEKFIEAQLDPFDENFQTPDYIRPCYCIGQNAREGAREHANKLFGTIDDHRNRFHALLATEPITEGDASAKMDERDRRWKEFIDPYVKAEEEAFEAHPNKLLPSPGCSDCYGTGLITSNYNPMSKWDWYVIGGRWDGYFMPGNICDLALFSEPEKSPYAIVTPGRIWNEKGRMGWWGMSFDEMSDEEWAVKVKSIAEKYAEEFVGVIVDCHI